MVSIGCLKKLRALRRRLPPTCECLCEQIHGPSKRNVSVRCVLLISHPMKSLRKITDVLKMVPFPVTFCRPT